LYLVIDSSLYAIDVHYKASSQVTERLMAAARLARPLPIIAPLLAKHAAFTNGGAAVRCSPVTAAHHEWRGALHREVSRRARVVSIFHNPASCLRLVAAVLAEISEELLTGRTYLTFQGSD